VNRFSKPVLNLMKVRFEEELLLPFPPFDDFTSLRLVSFNDAVSASYYMASNGEMTMQ
jgi:hypothetical protein